MEIGCIMKHLILHQNFYKLKQGFIQISQTIKCDNCHKEKLSCCSWGHCEYNVLITVRLVWDVK